MKLTKAEKAMLRETWEYVLAGGWKDGAALLLGGLGMWGTAFLVAFHFYG